MSRPYKEQLSLEPCLRGSPSQRYGFVKYEAGLSLVEADRL